jgi:hypothetical protein
VGGDVGNDVCDQSLQDGDVASECEVVFSF